MSLSRTSDLVAATAIVAFALGLSGCAAETVGTSPSVTARAPGLGASVAGPVPRPCVPPSSVDDLPPGIAAIVEATFVPGHAVSDSARGTLIPLEGVSVLWGSPSRPPTQLVDSPSTPSESDLLLLPGRYILLLTANSLGEYYIAEGRYGAFAFVDAQGNTLDRLCTIYAMDGKPRPPVKSEITIDRKTLLSLAVAAATSKKVDLQSMQPVPAPVSGSAG